MTSSESLRATHHRLPLYDALPPNSIRLLELQGTCLAGNDTDSIRDLAIRCSLKTVSLIETSEQSFHYAALSYVWGSAQNMRPISCNGKQKFVTANLHDALWKFLNYPKRPKYLWIDALCINQNDDEEKLSQIMLMGQIYSQAQVVLVWLGTGASVSGAPFERFWKYLGTHDLKGLDLDPYAAQKGLEFLSASDWFRRIWTFQEIVLARTAEFHCGPHFASWARPNSSRNIYYMLSSRSHSFNGLLDIHLARKKHAKEGQLDFSELILASTIREATVQQDRIYGLLGLYSGSWEGPTDYKATMDEVLAYASSVVALEQKNLHFLQQLDLSEVRSGYNPSILYGRAQVDSKQHNTGRPISDEASASLGLSWIPSWTRQSIARWRSTVRSRNPVASEKKFKDMLLNEADFPVMDKFSQTNSLSTKLGSGFSIEGTTLYVTGTILGRLERLDRRKSRDPFLQLESFRYSLKCLAEHPKDSKNFCSASEIFKVLQTHDNDRRDCMTTKEPETPHEHPSEAQEYRERPVKYSNFSAKPWICELDNRVVRVNGVAFKAEPFALVLEPLYDEHTDSVSLVILGRYRGEVEQAVGVRTTFKILGKLPENYKSTFWLECTKNNRRYAASHRKPPIVTAPPGPPIDIDFYA